MEERSAPLAWMIDTVEMVVADILVVASVRHSAGYFSWRKFNSLPLW
jgi:hypothetical protein